MSTTPEADVLLVEDDVDLSDALAENLRDEGFSVAVAMDGHEAVAYLEAAPVGPAVILLDLMMPRMDGFQFRRWQLAAPRHATIPVIITTANSHALVDAAALRPQAVLRKPFKITALIDLLRRLAVSPSR